MRDVFAALLPVEQRQAEQWFRQNVGGVAFGFNSGRASLWAILRTLGIKDGDEVVISGFTCFAVPEAVIYAGGKPVYADIDINAWSFWSARATEMLWPKDACHNCSAQLWPFS